MSLNILQSRHDELVLKRDGMIRVQEQLWDGDPQWEIIEKRVEALDDILLAIKKRMVDLSH